MKLDISINLNDDCEIIVSDTTQYPTDLSKIVFIEFLCYQSYDDDKDTILPIERSKVINKTLNRSYRYKTGYDGYYKYSKYGIYTYSDEVLFIYRDSYYNKENKNDIAEIIVEKNKKGNTGIVKLKWIPEYLKFSNTIENI